MPRITQISPSVPKIKTKLKVAAYARVSGFIILIAGGVYYVIQNIFGRVGNGE